jgi:hypothetical protein
VDVSEPTDPKHLTDVFDDPQARTTPPATPAPATPAPATPAPARDDTTASAPADPTAPTTVSFPDGSATAGGATTATATADGGTTGTEPAEIQMPPEWAGRGRPPRPEIVRDEIQDKQHRSEALRQHARQLDQQGQRVDADVNLANQLLAERTQDYQELQDRANALNLRGQAVQRDLDRTTPDVDDAAARVIMLRRQLGEPMAGDTDLQNPSGTPPPVVTVETDPQQVAVLREQLTAAQAALDKAHQAQAGLQSELARIHGDQDDLAPKLQEAEGNWTSQREHTEALEARAEQLDQEAKGDLESARVLEADAQHLTDALPDYDTVWQQWATEHPDEAKRTDLGTVEVHASARERAEAYAQGRRADAGRLEQQANDADKAAADAVAGMQMRVDLAQRREEEAGNLTHRAEAATTRAAVIQGEADTARQQSDRLAADADRMSTEANQLRAAGNTEAADTMQARANAANNRAIEARVRSSQLEADATRTSNTGIADGERAAQLTKEAQTLRSEATTLLTEQSAHEKEAAKLREDAASRDTVAKDVEVKLASGQPFHLTGDPNVGGGNVDIDVPAGPPPGAVDATTSADASASDEAGPSTADPGGIAATLGDVGDTDSPAAADDGGDVLGTGGVDGDRAPTGVDVGGDLRTPDAPPGSVTTEGGTGAETTGADSTGADSTGADSTGADIDFGPKDQPGVDLGPSPFDAPDPSAISVDEGSMSTSTTDDSGMET